MKFLLLFLAFSRLFNPVCAPPASFCTQGMCALDFEASKESVFKMDAFSEPIFSLRFTLRPDEVVGIKHLESGTLRYPGKQPQHAGEGNDDDSLEITVSSPALWKYSPFYAETFRGGQNTLVRRLDNDRKIGSVVWIEGEDGDVSPEFVADLSIHCSVRQVPYIKENHIPTMHMRCVPRRESGEDTLPGGEMEVEHNFHVRRMGASSERRTLEGEVLFAREVEKTGYDKPHAFSLKPR